MMDLSLLVYFGEPLGSRIRRWLVLAAGGSDLTRSSACSRSVSFVVAPASSGMSVSGAESVAPHQGQGAGVNRANTDHELGWRGHDWPMQETRGFSTEDETRRFIDNTAIAPVGTGSE